VLDYLGDAKLRPYRKERMVHSCICPIGGPSHTCGDGWGEPCLACESPRHGPDGAYGFVVRKAAPVEERASYLEIADRVLAASAFSSGLLTQNNCSGLSVTGTAVYGVTEIHALRRRRVVNQPRNH
jgi:hypothetical protein